MYRKLYCVCLLLAAILPIRAQMPVKIEKGPTLAEMFDELLAGKRPLESFRLDVKSADGTSVTIHGDGVGILWLGKQFRLSHEQRLDFLRKLKAADFLALPERMQELETENGRISLKIGSQSKVVALREGSETAVVARLAKDLITACEKESATGIGADSLTDGLKKILNKKLDARVLKIEARYLRHQEFYHLEIEGQAAKIKGAGYSANSFRGHKSLTIDQLNGFIEMAIDKKFQELPKNIRPTSDFYWTLTIQVLDKQHHVFGMSDGNTEPLPEEFPRFEALWNASRALHPQYDYLKKKP